MKWFKQLPLEKKYYYLYLFNLFGTLNCIYLAMAYNAWSFYLLAAWTMSSVLHYMRKEEELYNENIQT